jgi:Tol biopolymer transport system component
MDNMKIMRSLSRVLLIIASLFLSVNVNAQYFGRNKPSYRSFDYKVYQTPNFDIYYYWKNDSLLNKMAYAAQTWYGRHQFMLHDTIKFKNPLIIYLNQTDFQQTDAIMGEIGVGTGGVTEAFKNRVVIPLLDTWQQTDHVLGHELVHAFQYNIVINGDSTSIGNLRNLPLWMVEGMAEYMSIGSIDSHTAMWLRDAVLNNDFPTLRDLTDSYRFFPYRYGQAFWAFTTRLYGDTIVLPLFKQASLMGYEAALDSVLGYDETTFSRLWKSATFDYYHQWIKDTVDHVVGDKLLYEKTAGKMNLAPTISPDGKTIAYLSERDLFSIDLYLSDIKTGKIIRKLSSSTKNNRIDDFSYIESAGSWSPDSKNIAMIIYSRGKNKLLIVNAENPNKQTVYEIPGVPAMCNPAWSPSGNQIVVSGQKEGVSSLYLFDLNTEKVERLTNETCSFIQPSWSNDGTRLVFATDKSLNETDTTIHLGYALGVLNIDNKQITYYNLFPGADNLNPHFAPDGKSIYFLSNSDGFRNLYRFYPSENKVFRLTNLLTGISGITPYSPAMSIARDTSLIVYSHYCKGIYTVYKADASQFTEIEVDPTKIDMRASMLPPGTKVGMNIIDKNMRSKDFHPYPIDSFKTVAYKPKFKLDYIGNTGFGIATSSYGTGIAGSVDMLFSDMVGNNTLYANLALNGEVSDLGGQLAYVNSKHRIDWGGSVSHIPYRYGYMYYQDVDTAVIATTDIYHLFQEEASLFAIYAISATQRLEVGSSFAHYSYRLDRTKNYYFDDGTYGYSKEKNIPSGRPSFTIEQLKISYVVDNSYFGIASPLRGYRGRLQIERNFGSVDMYSLTADYRKYIYMRPFCLAFRGLHYGRYGADSENNLLSPMYLGYPWYVRGYGNDYFQSEEAVKGKGVVVEQLFGSRMALANVELRVPFTGPERASLIKSKMFYTELAVFFDGGLTWTSKSLPHFSFDYSNRQIDPNKTSDENYYTITIDDNYKHYPVFSTGISLRVNLFGALILEPYYAIPLFQGAKAAAFGLNFFPGW